jgi:queuine tRNA-ribosyltransferase
MSNPVTPEKGHHGRRATIPGMDFRVEAVDGAARAGRLTLNGREVETPLFMPVATHGTVKALTASQLAEVGGQVVLMNAYHFHLRGMDGVVARAGGLHRFTGWSGGIITDSGGFQRFSLAHLCEVSDTGYRFRSHLDGSWVDLTPEGAVAVQEALGADIAMVLDECPPYSTDRAAVEAATARSHAWAERCLAAKRRPDQALFGIVQGGVFPDLRRWSAETVAGLGFAGFGIGGLSVGEGKPEMYAALEATTAYLPPDRPRYLMGVGSPEDLVEAVARGADLFDATLPTRVARHGGLFTPEGRRNIRAAAFREMMDPIDADCDCPACRGVPAAFLHHLFRAEPDLAHPLATLHNLRFLFRLMDGMREAIVTGRFSAFREEFLTRYRPADPAVRAVQQGKWAEAARRRRGGSDQGAAIERGRG